MVSAKPRSPYNDLVRIRERDGFLAPYYDSGVAAFIAEVRADLHYFPSIVALGAPNKPPS